MKYKKFLLIILLCIFSLIPVYATGDIEIESIKVIKSSDGVVLNDKEKVNVTFNDLLQEVKYEAVIRNNTDQKIYVNSLEQENKKDQFIEYKLDTKSENMAVEPNSTSKVSFYVKTLAVEGAGRNLNEQVQINFLVSDKLINPSTYSDLLSLFILITILGITIYYSRKNKKAQTFILVFVLSIIGIRYVEANDYIKAPVTGNVEYKSQNNIISSGTTLNNKQADYTNSKEVWAYYDKVKNVEIKSLMNEPSEYFKEFDLTENKTGRVKAYLIENKDKDAPYDLIIMSQGVVIANKDSSFMFSFPNTEKVDGLKNIDFSETESMKGMFIGNKKVEEIDTNSIKLDNVKDTSYMFYDNENLDITIKDFNTEHVENIDDITYMTKNYLYDIVKAKAKSDKDMDYYYSTDSGNFLYSNSNNQIYYYRGDVKDNNIKFANYCWSIVRTTETNGIKLLYNGTPDENGKCIEHNPNATLPNAERFSAFNYHLGAVGYMYGDTVSLKKKKLTSVTENYVYGNDVVYDEQTGMYTLIDTITSSNWKDDMKKIMKRYHYSCFNETGTCSTAYYITDPSNSVSNYGTTQYIADSYYIEVKSGQKFEDAIKASQKNINNSNVKTVIDKWYAENLINYTNYLEDEKWCNDRTIISGALSSKDYDTEKSNSYNYFSANERIFIDYKGNNSYLIPSLTCQNENDNFTVSAENGNGALTYPVALLTVDELGLIGGFMNTNNKYFYTKNCWWTMTSRYIGEDWTYAYRFYSGYTYQDTTYYSKIDAVNINVSGSGFIRPAISLKPGTQFISGTGTYENPYIIEEIEQ